MQRVRQLTVVCLLAFASAARAATVTVGAGGDLQAAITNAQPGDTILLASGATYTGNFTLPNKGGSSAFITIRTSATAGMPPAGGRVGPGDAPLLAKLRSPNSLPAVQTSPSAHHWMLQLLEITSSAAAAGDLVTLGDGSTAQSSLSQVPHDLVLDRVYVHADPANALKRAIALNSAATTVSGCYIAEVKAAGQDNQAIAGWNGPGPYTITNNYLEAAGENVLFGGADPAIPNLVPADIVLSGNNIVKQIAWRGSKWTVKNLIELKNARRATITDNALAFNWQAGQAGFAVVLTVRNQDGGCPWCQVDHVTFANNVVAHSAAGVTILGTDNNHPSRQAQAIEIRDNLFADIDDAHWGGNGYFLTIDGGPRDVTVDHNTVASDHAFGVIEVQGPPVLGFSFTNNLMKHNQFGVIGADHRIGADTISAYFPAADFTHNVLAGGSASLYPPGNSFPTVSQFEAQFVGYTAQNYALIASSVWRAAGTDGSDLGATGSVIAAPGLLLRPPRDPCARWGDRPPCLGGRGGVSF
jgi:hypothetical protein